MAPLTWFNRQLDRSLMMQPSRQRRLRERGYVASGLVFLCVLVIASAWALVARVLVATVAAGGLLGLVRWEAADDRHHQLVERVRRIAFRAYLTLLILFLAGAVVLLVVR